MCETTSGVFKKFIFIYVLALSGLLLPHGNFLRRKIMQ